MVGSVQDVLSAARGNADLQSVPLLRQLYEAMLVQPLLLAAVLVCLQLVLLYLCGLWGARLLRNRHRQISQLWSAILCLGLLLVPFHGLLGGWSLEIASLDQVTQSPLSVPELNTSSAVKADADMRLEDEHTNQPSLASMDRTDRGIQPIEDAAGWEQENDFEATMQTGSLSDGGQSLGRTRDANEVSANTPSEELTTNQLASLAWGQILTGTLLSLYTAVVAWFLLSNVRGALCLRAFRLQGQPAGRATREIVESAAKQMRLRNVPEILECAGLPIPLTCGIRRPLVMLPEGFLNWDSQEQRMVLLHEFAHIQRHDLFGELLARGLTILFWFHPASWFMARQQRTARELAADEMVVVSGADKFRYANCLVSVLQRMSQSPSDAKRLPVVAMATNRNIESRVLALVSGSSVPARSAKLMGALLALIVLSLLGSSFRLRTVSSAQAQETRAGVSESDENDAPLLIEKEPGRLRYNPDRLQSSVSLIDRVADCLVTPVVADSHGPIFNISGVVNNPDGSPAVGATVILRESSQLRVSSEPKLLEASERHLLAVPDVFAKTTTDAQGRYQFHEVKSPMLPEDRFREYWRWNLIALSDEGFAGRDLDTTRLPVKTITGADLALEETRSIRATVVDANGAVVPNAIVHLSSLVPADQVNRALGRPSEHEVQTWMSVVTPMVRADANGQVAFSGLPVGHVAFLQATHQDFAGGFGSIATSDDAPLGQVAKYGLPDEPRFRTQASPAKIEMEFGHRLRGRILAGGRPVADVRVGLRSSVPMAQTDEAGRFDLRYSSLQTRGGPVQLVLYPPENSDLLHGHHTIDAGQVDAAGVDAVELGDLELEQGVRIVGSVFCDGKPVPHVWVAPTQTAEDLANLIRGVASTKEGTFELIVPAKATTIFLTTDIPGFKLASTREGRGVRNDTIPEDWPQRGVPISDADVGRTIELEPFHIESTASITVQAVLPDGIPTSLGNVTVKDKSHRNPERPDETIGGPVSIDERGRAVLKLAGVPSSDAYAEVHVTTPDGGYTGRKLLSRTGDDEVLTVELQSGMLLRGNVSLNGKPVQGARVRISKSEPIDERGAFRSTPLTTVATDANGDYAAGVERVERYSVFVESVPGQPESPNRGHNASPSPSGVVEVARFDLRTGSEEIHGVVLDGNRKPLAGISISVSPQFTANGMPILMGWRENSQLTTDQQGRFIIRSLAQGEYQIRAYSRQNLRGTSEVSAVTGDKNVKIFIASDESRAPRRLTVQSISDY